MGATDLKRYIIKTIYASVRSDRYGPPFEAIHLVCKNTSSSSGIRRIIVAFFVWQAAEGWWIKDKDDKDNWKFQDMAEGFRSEVAIATFERVHLMDDGNPFHESDEVTETGLGADYFYDDDESANLGSQKWLRDDPDRLRPVEEQRDAALFEADAQTAADGDMINDEEEDNRKRETAKNTMTTSDPAEAVYQDTGSASDEGSDVWKDTGLDMEEIIGNVWLEHSFLVKGQDMPQSRSHAAKELLSRLVNGD